MTNTTSFNSTVIDSVSTIEELSDLRISKLTQIDAMIVSLSKVSKSKAAQRFAEVFSTDFISFDMTISVRENLNRARDLFIVQSDARYELLSEMSEAVESDEEQIETVKSTSKTRKQSSTKSEVTTDELLSALEDARSSKNKAEQKRLRALLRKRNVYLSTFSKEDKKQIAINAKFTAE